MAGYQSRGGGGAVAGDLDVEFDDTFDVTDDINAELDVPDTVGMGDALTLDGIDLADTVDLGDEIPATTLEATATDSVDVGDAPSAATVLADTVDAADSLAPFAANAADTVDLSDIFAQQATLSVAERVYAKESALTANLTNVVAWQDSWTDEGNTGVNHGTDTALSIQQSIILTQDGRRAFIAWDLTKIVGFEAVPGDDLVTISVTMNPPVLNVAATMSAHSLISTSQPWTEAGITWANQPAHPTLENETLLNLIAAGFTHTFVLTSTVGAVLGKWVSIQLSFQALIAVVGNFTAQSRENAGAKPIMSFRARHAGVAAS